MPFHNICMNYANIKYNDIANGEGVRTTLFVSGCRNHCLNCFQPETWNFNYGAPYTEETEKALLDSLSPSYIAGLTLLGGDPFEPENQEGIVGLLRKVKKEFPDKTVWAYTGYILDQDLLDGGRKHTPYTDEILSLVDVLVDGPFIQDQYDISLQFRGSRNQRIIDVPASLKAQEIVLYLP